MQIGKFVHNRTTSAASISQLDISHFHLAHRFAIFTAYVRRTNRAKRRQPQLLSTCATRSNFKAMAFRLFLSVAFLIDFTIATGAPGDSSTVTFARDVAPIIFQRCAGCHRPGQAAPFNLLTYEDVKKRAKLVAEVVGKKYMPPWLPEAGPHAFLD